jgi:hypothetical protein
MLRDASTIPMIADTALIGKPISPMMVKIKINDVMGNAIAPRISNRSGIKACHLTFVLIIFFG